MSGGCQRTIPKYEGLLFSRPLKRVILKARLAQMSAGAIAFAMNFIALVTPHRFCVADLRRSRSHRVAMGPVLLHSRTIPPSLRVVTRAPHNVEHAAFNERAPAHEFGVAFREVVGCDRQETRRGEHLAGMAADEAGAPSDENGLHAVPCAKKPGANGTDLASLRGRP
jgi:hypothetical protein